MVQIQTKKKTEKEKELSGETSGGVFQKHVGNQFMQIYFSAIIITTFNICDKKSTATRFHLIIYIEKINVSPTDRRVLKVFGTSRVSN